MSRPRSIDREKLLDAAQALVAAAGTGELTFGKVAEAAGVAKSTVQAVFGSRTALIEAMLERWLAREERHFVEVAGPAPTRREKVSAHIATMQAERMLPQQRVATLLAAFAATEHRLVGVASWYRTRFDGLEAETAQERQLRIAFLAAEGLFFVRYLAGLAVDDALWDQMLKDLQAFVHQPSSCAAPCDTDTL